MSNPARQQVPSVDPKDTFEALPEKQKKSGNVIWLVLKKSKLGMISFVFLILVIVMAISAPLISPYDPVIQNVQDRMQPPSAEHWLGTDAFGRDIWSRIIYGSQISLLVGFISVVISGIIGTTLGMIAGYKGGLFDDILMRIIESIMSIPLLLIGLMLLVALGSSATTVIIALSIGFIPSCARIARGPAMEIKEKEFVKAAIACGASTTRILFVHILRNILSPVLVLSSLHMGSAIRVEASLSFLGLGIQPPNPTWGNMIYDGMKFLTSAPWTVVYPGFALMIVVIAFNLFGDTLRDAFDPHIVRKRK